MSSHIYVSISLGDEIYLVGRLWCHYRKGRESASFEYDQNWLEHKERFALEPALALTAGSFHTDLNVFGSIGDSAPDRWGRVLMRRRNLSEPGRTVKLREQWAKSIFCLGVSDEVRQGALRFSDEKDGPFLAQDGRHAISPLVDLPRPLSATERFLDEDEDAGRPSHFASTWLVPGWSLTESVSWDNDGQLAIAKFPRNDDESNGVVWEAIALILAERAGLECSSGRLLDIAGKSVLLVRRFDRQGTTRVPFLSAMSMLQARTAILTAISKSPTLSVSTEQNPRRIWRRCGAESSSVSLFQTRTTIFEITVSFTNGL